MKVICVGPSLHGSAKAIPPDIKLLPPAAQGDIYNCVQNGANVIGIVDGMFEDRASPWHKEILFALSAGVRVYGAASMGALRAAECADFGMVGIGEIFEWYRNGSTVDDADVAISHGPGELGYVPLSVPMVNVRATVTALLGRGRIEAVETDALTRCAAEIFFKDRTWSAVIAAANLPLRRAREIAAIISDLGRNLKREDAEALVDVIAVVEDRRDAPSDWTFQRTGLFERWIVG